MSTPSRVRAIALPGAPRPVEALRRLRGLRHRVLLETAAGEGRSFLAAEPVALVRSREGRVEIAAPRAPEEGRRGAVPEVPSSRSAPACGRGEDGSAPRGKTEGLHARTGFLAALAREWPELRTAPPDPFTTLERLLRWLAPGGPSSRSNGARLVPEPGELAPAGGIFGYLGYEAGDVLEPLPPAPREPERRVRHAASAPPIAATRERGHGGARAASGASSGRGGLPESWFGIYPWTIVWGRDGGCELRGRCLPGMEPEAFETELRSVRDTLLDDDREAPDRRGGSRCGGAPELLSGPALLPLRGHPGAFSSMGEDRFRAGVERIREYIRAGDLFQANLTHRISRATALGGEELLARLRRESPAPYLAYFDTGEGEIVSISPELFLSLSGRTVETRPIKGTAPRGSTPEEDRRLAATLQGSEKERAENVMIVDLLRNDLSRVCIDGSVEVPELLLLESHPTVHHLVSRVRGDLGEGAGVVDLLRASFPGGSITGAPKIRAMEILRELEPVPRGVYTGALGMLTFEGDAELSIAIRTAVVRHGIAEYGAGGGITLASDSGAEWRETLQKAAAFLRATEP